MALTRQQAETLAEEDRNESAPKAGEIIFYF